MEQNTDSNLLKGTYIFNLYMNNQERFHDWLRCKKSDILSSGWTPFLFTLLCILFAVFIFVSIHNLQEISETEYGWIITREGTYGDEMPGLTILIKKSMDDNVITNGEFNELNKLMVYYFKEKTIIRNNALKKKLLNQIK